MSNNPSRDSIALQMFGRKFSQLSTEGKMSVNKTWVVLDRSSKSGADSSDVLRKTALNEAILVVKQLKEIGANPGDQIELPKGVLEDAARVLHIHYQATGNKKPLSKGDIVDIRREVQRQFKTTNPEVVECVADYLSNPTGRFSGAGLKTLRRKLRSFLTEDQFENIQDKEILAARDITIAHMFDKWTHGNLSSFVQPKMEDLLVHDVKTLQKKNARSAPMPRLEQETIQETLQSLAALEKMQNSSSRTAANPFARLAMKRLGINPAQVFGSSTKSALGEIVNTTHQFASTRLKGHPSLGGGIRLRRNWKLHPGWSPEASESRLTSYPTSGIGKPTKVFSRSVKTRMGDRWKWIADSMIESDDSTGGYSLSHGSGWKESDEANFGFSPDAEEEYGTNMLGPNNRKEEERFRNWYGHLDFGPKKILDFKSNRLDSLMPAVTKAQANMGLYKIDREMRLEDYSDRADYIDYCKGWLGAKWGEVWGHKLFEAGVPLQDASNIFRTTRGADQTNAIKAAIEYGDNYKFTREERTIGVNQDEFKMYDPATMLSGISKELPSPVIKSMQKFHGMFSDAPSALPGELDHLLTEVAQGKTKVPGTTRVGIVGSKAFQDKKRINQWFARNWDDSKLMITSTEVGKSTGEIKENLGAAFHASNWAHHTGALQYKFPVRAGNVGTKREDMTTADVINASDEVVAFFDMLHPGASDIEQIKKIQKSIGDKPLRIVWIPSNVNPEGDMSSAQRKKLLPDRIADLMAMKNVTLDAFDSGVSTAQVRKLKMENDMHPGSVPWLPLRMLAGGGDLKSGEAAIVGEKGPELLIPKGGGTHTVVPNNKLESYNDILHFDKDSLYYELLNETKGRFKIPAFLKGYLLELKSLGDSASIDESKILNVVDRWYDFNEQFEEHSSKSSASGLEYSESAKSNLNEIESKIWGFISNQVNAAVNRSLSNGNSVFDNLPDSIKRAFERRGVSNPMWPIETQNAMDSSESAWPNKNPFNYTKTKLLQKGGPLKSNEMAIVGEAGPELLVPGRNGGYNVLPNKDLRKLYSGTIGLSSFTRDVTNEPQPDPHDYTDPDTGEVWPSVTKIQKLGKQEKYGSSYYSDVGSVAHYWAAKALGAQHGIDVSHVQYPEITGASETNKAKTYHSAEDIANEGALLGKRFVELANEIGFIPTMIEKRFVNTADKYSGTVDIAGNMRDELGNLVPVIADFKTGSKFEAEKFAEQMGGYAQFFSNQVNGMVIHMSRDMQGLGPITVDIIKGAQDFRDKLSKYNTIHGPRPVRVTGGAEDAAGNRLFDMANRMVEVFDVRSNEKYMRQGIGATTPGHAAALSKIFPGFEQSGPTPGNTWDKNPSRLNVFGERIKEIEESLSGEGVHPMIKGAMAELKDAGFDADHLRMLAEAGMGDVEDHPETLDLFNKIYQTLKPIGFNQGLLSTGKNLDSTLWNDSIAILNILEEGAKSFASVPRLPHMKYSPKSSSPGIAPAAVPGSPTTGPSIGDQTGPAAPDYEKIFAAKFLGNIEHATGLQKYIERIPAIGGAVKMHRQQSEIKTRTVMADKGDWEDKAPKGYWKLLEKEEQARNKYFRSIRSATTSFLIAQHVMRIFGQTSQVYAKSAEGVGKGLGYVFDMFLMPLSGWIGPIVNQLTNFGGWLRKFPALFPPIVVAGGALVAGLTYSAAKTYMAFRDLPDSLDRLASSAERLSLASGGDYASPIGPEKPGMFQRLKTKLGFAMGGVVPGTGNSDSVLAMLTPGEAVLSKPMLRSMGIKGYADGGIVGGMSSILGGVTSAYGSIVSSDAGSAALAGLGMVSRTMGALMAPLAPAIAGGALAGKGISMVVNAINRMRSSNESINGSGFGALRTMAAAQLAGSMSGLAPLVPIGAAILGIYAWTQGYGAFVEGSWNSIKSGVKTVGDLIKGGFDWIRSFFKPKEIKVPDVKSPWKWEGKTPEEKFFKGGKYLEPKAETVKAAEEKARLEKEAKDKVEKGSSKSELLKGVPSMALLGGAMGAMESKDPADWLKSAGMAGAAQIGLNALGIIATKVGGPATGEAVKNIVGGVLAPGFGKTVGDLTTTGAGPLSPSQYIPGLKGNTAIDKLVGATTTMALSAGTGGLAMDREMLGGIDVDRYIAMKYPETTGASTDSILKQVLDALLALVGNTKQPTINQNTFEIKNDDDYALMQKIQNVLATVGNQSGAQRTG